MSTRGSWPARSSPRSQGPRHLAARFREINDWERYLTDQGRFVKYFLNVSKEEQRRRFLAGIDEPDRNWKFSSATTGTVVLGRLPEGVQRCPLEHEHALGPVVRRPGRDKRFAGRGRRRPGPHPDRDRSEVPEGSKEALEALQETKVDLVAQAPKGQTDP